MTGLKSLVERLGRRSRSRPCLSISLTIFLLLLGIVGYLPVLDAWFVGDDVDGIWGAHVGGDQNVHVGKNFRPLNLWIHGQIFDFAGFDSRPFHLVSLLLHVGAAALIVLVARALFDSFRISGGASISKWVPLLAGTLFVIMPNHTESVSWIAGVGDIEITVFSLLALLSWLAKTRTWAVHAAGLASFALALACKETATALPFVLSLVEIARRPDMSRSISGTLRAALRPWPYYLVLLLYLGVRRASMGEVSSIPLREEFIGDSVPILVARWAVLYVRTYLPGMSWAWWTVAISALGIAMVAVIVWWLRRSPRAATGRVRCSEPARLILFLLFVPALALAPVARLGASPFDSGGERFVYFSSSFSCILLAWMLVKFATVYRRAGTAAIVLVIVAFSASLASTNARWAEAGELAESVTTQFEKWPKNEPIYLLSTPDTIGGAYVMRNSERASLAAIYDWDFPPSFTSLSATRMTGSDDRVELVQGPIPNSWKLTLLEPDSSFLDGGTPEAVSHGGLVEIQELTPNTRVFYFDKAVPESQIWFLNQGELRRVPAFQR